MTKHLIFIFTLLCSLQLHAGVQLIRKDTVQYLSKPKYYPNLTFYYIEYQ